MISLFAKMRTVTQELRRSKFFYKKPGNEDLVLFYDISMGYGQWISASIKRVGPRGSRPYRGKQSEKEEIKKEAATNFPNEEEDV